MVSYFANRLTARLSNACCFSVFEKQTIDGTNLIFSFEMVNSSTGTLTMRLVRSKLRKREESETVIRTPINVSVAEQEDNTNAQDIETISTNSKDKQHVTFVRTSGAVPIATVGHTAVAEWTFPPKAPVPHIYHINQDMLMANDKITFKGFRKQFSGRFKRLVARKPEPAPVIPPELKPQLKTIYVY